MIPELSGSGEAISAIETAEGGVWTQTATPEQIEAQLLTTGGTPFPLAVKANIGVRGFRRSAACPVFDTVAEEADAQVVALLRRSGAVVVGTTNMHELAFGVTSVNAAYGTPTVPGHPGRSAGGSSGGSAAAVARGDVPIALGTDTGGSVSIPAAHCGLVGFRPSTGRWPGEGVLGLSTTRDTPGLFARSVDEVASIDLAVAGGGVSSGVPVRPRIGLPEQLIERLHPETMAAFRSSIERLGDRVEMVPVDYAEVLALTAAAEKPLVLWEARRLLGDAAGRALTLAPDAAFAVLADRVASPDVRKMLQEQLRSPVTADAYAAAQRSVVEARAASARLHALLGLDALLFPTAPAPAPPADAGATVEHLGRRESTFELYTRHTCQGTMLGAPMLTLPAPVPEGALPVGITVQGFRFGDRELLALARAIEAILAAI